MSSALASIKHCVRFTQLAFSSAGDSFVAGDQQGNIYIFYLSRNTYVLTNVCTRLWQKFPNGCRDGSSCICEGIFIVFVGLHY